MVPYHCLSARPTVPGNRSPLWLGSKEGRKGNRFLPRRPLPKSAPLLPHPPPCCRSQRRRNEGETKEEGDAPLPSRPPQSCAPAALSPSLFQSPAATQAIHPLPLKERRREGREPLSSQAPLPPQPPPSKANPHRPTLPGCGETPECKLFLKRIVGGTWELKRIAQTHCDKERVVGMSSKRIAKKNELSE